MSHDLEAAFAATEVVTHLLSTPEDCFVSPPTETYLSGCTVREGRFEWPHSDGLIELVDSSGSSSSKYNIALEFKRPNEGRHGVLTAIGQSHAYLRKGYAGAVIVIPELYPGFSNPGPYVKEVIDLTSKSESIGVFTYTKPNMSVVSPFAGTLTLHRRFKIDVAPPISTDTPSTRTATQWAHVREGSTDPDAFFKYLQCLKLLGGEGIEPFAPNIPAGLRDAVERLRPGADPEKYLSNCQNDTLPDRAWRRFWFKYVLYSAAIPGWEVTGGCYLPNAVPLLIQKSDGSGQKMFFVGRSDSIKVKLCTELNRATVTLDTAFEKLAKNYHKRAHSYREDIDSGCEHFGFIDREGRLTDSGYKFVDACERFGNPNEGLPRAIFLNALLNEGSLGAFLHYVHRLSEALFQHDPLAFSDPPVGRTKVPSFNNKDYLIWLESEMESNLRVIRKVSTRGGVARKPFQAELAILRNLGIVSRSFRIGVGMVINWPVLQEAMLFQESSLPAYHH